MDRMEQALEKVVLAAGMVLTVAVVMTLLGGLVAIFAVPSWSDASLRKCGDPGTGCTVGNREDMSITRPDRGDAQDCLIDAELRKMDPKSVWLPENGHHVKGEWSKCPD